MIIGAGYVGKELGVKLAESGERVLGTQTGSVSDEPFPLREYSLGDPDQLKEILDELDGSFRCVFTAGPPRMESNEESLERYERFLRALPRDRLDHFLFLSSTSVYGDTGGEWVTETTPPDPYSESGRLKIRAEEATEETLGPTVPVAHARIGGIYGPGRNTAKRYLSDDYSLVGNGEKFSNRIHRADLVRALLILSQSNISGSVNLTDRKPVRLRDLVEFLYRETGRDPSGISTISWEEAEEEYSEMRLGLLKPRKKVSSEKLRVDVGFEYEYPTAYHGFRSLAPLAGGGG